MSDYQRCKTCDEWGWLSTHKCPPLWVVAPEDSPEDMFSVYGLDAEVAAEKAAERYDGDNYYLARGNCMVFLVGTSEDGGTLVRVSVQGETVPHYSARELGPATPPVTPPPPQFWPAKPD